LHLTQITVKRSWSAPARLHLVPHLSAPMAGLTLPGGTVPHVYMES
jgi:acetoacetate decarboxylase